MKKFMTVALATAMTVAMSASAFADYADGTAYLNFNAAGWTSSAACDGVAVTADGTYTVTASFDEATALEQFNALEIMNGDTLYGHDVEITITSVKFDGTEVLSGTNYTCSADGKGETTRANIYNAWNTPDDLNVVDEKSGYADNRATGKTEDEVSATIISADYIGGDLTVKDIEVTFTVTGVSEAAASADVAPVAYLAAIVAVAGIAMVASKKRA